ncbi:MAG TPA: hypothetical protein VGH00_07575 [Chthoniobacterales bacterium]
MLMLVLALLIVLVLMLGVSLSEHLWPGVPGFRNADLHVGSAD